MEENGPEIATGNKTTNLFLVAVKQDPLGVLRKVKSTGRVSLEEEEGAGREGRGDRWDSGQERWRPPRCRCTCQKADGGWTRHCRARPGMRGMMGSLLRVSL